MTESGERERADEVEHLVRQCVRGRYTVREAIQAAFEAGRGQEADKLADLINCWDVFYTFLPDGEYRGLAQMRAAANQHRVPAPPDSGDATK